MYRNTLDISVWHFIISHCRACFGAVCFVGYYKRLLCVCLLAIPVSGYASTMTFGGISFVGNADQDHRYPYARAFFAQDAVGLNRIVMQSLKNLQRTDLNILYGLGNIQSGDAKVLTLAVQSENIERIREQGGVYSFYNVLASVMVFDMVAKKIVSNFPIAIQHQEFTPQTPTADDDSRIFKKIYYDLDFQGSLVNAWVQKLETLTISNATPLHIQIHSLSLDDDVAAQLPDRLSRNNTFIVQTAQVFETLLASHQNVPILPFSVGRLGNKKDGLIARFADGVSYTLTIPKADFNIDILIRKFKQVTLDAASYDGYIFGSFITLTVSEPLSGQVFLHSKFNLKNKMIFSKKDQIVITDPWDIYLKTQSNLFAILTKQISVQDKNTLQQITKTADITQQLTKFQEILEKCRY